MAAPTIYLEYEYSRTEQVLELELRFYVSETASTPVVTDTWHIDLIQDSITVTDLRQRLHDRIRELETGIEQFNSINSALNAGQNTRIKAEDIL